MQKTQYAGMMKIEDGIILQNDNMALNEYKKTKMRNRALNNYENDIEFIKNELKEIKEILQKMVI